MEQDTSPVRRKRRTKHRRKELTRLQLFLRGKTLTYAIFAVMLLVTAIYSYVVVAPLLEARERLGLVRIGMNRAEVLYLLGNPTARDPANSDWKFNKDGRIETVHFDVQGNVDLIGCSVLHEVSDICPTSLSLGVSSREEEIMRRLGPADRISFVNGMKKVQYYGTGLEFDIVGGEARAMRLARSNDSSRMMRQIIWALLP